MTETVWRARDPASFRWREWDDQHVVYHTASGDTHLLDRTAGEILRRLREAPATTDALSAAVARDLELEVTPELGEAVETLLARLVELGVAEEGA